MARELRIGEYVVKRFSKLASVQELILAAFQEQGWPRRIDDPLPPKPGCDAKRHLLDTIRNMNLRRTRPGIRFHGDGTGRGIRWTLEEED